MPHAINASDVRGSVGASAWKPGSVVRDAGAVVRHHHHRGNLKDPVGRKIQKAWLDLEEQHNERVSVVDRVVQRTSI